MRGRSPRSPHWEQTAALLWDSCAWTSGCHNFQEGGAFPTRCRTCWVQSTQRQQTGPRRRAAGPCPHPSPGPRLSHQRRGGGCASTPMHSALGHLCLKTTAVQLRRPGRGLLWTNRTRTCFSGKTREGRGRCWPVWQIPAGAQ